MFKPNQKVKYIGRSLPIPPNFLVPEVGAIVTIKQKCPCGCIKCWEIVEFPLDVDGEEQSFPEHVLMATDEG